MVVPSGIFPFQDSSHLFSWYSTARKSFLSPCISSLVSLVCVCSQILTYTAFTVKQRVTIECCGDRCSNEHRFTRGCPSSWLFLVLLTSSCHSSSSPSLPRTYCSRQCPALTLEFTMSPWSPDSCSTEWYREAQRKLEAGPVQSLQSLSLIAAAVATKHFTLYKWLLTSLQSSDCSLPIQNAMRSLWDVGCTNLFFSLF